MAGDNVGVLLRGVEKADVERGQVLAKPGTMKGHTKFKGEIYILSKEEGGRHTPFFTGYRPQFYIRTTDVTGILKLPEGVEMVMPGDNTSITGELITPVAIEKGGRFAIREGGRTVGSGRSGIIGAVRTRWIVGLSMELARMVVRAVSWAHGGRSSGPVTTDIFDSPNYPRVRTTTDSPTEASRATEASETNVNV